MPTSRSRSRSLSELRRLGWWEALLLLLPLALPLPAVPGVLTSISESPRSTLTWARDRAEYPGERGEGNGGDDMRAAVGAGDASEARPDEALLAALAPSRASTSTSTLPLPPLPLSLPMLPRPGAGLLAVLLVLPPLDIFVLLSRSAFAASWTSCVDCWKAV